MEYGDNSMSFNPVISGGGVGRLEQALFHATEEVSIRSFPGVVSDKNFQKVHAVWRSFNPVISGGGVGHIEFVEKPTVKGFNPVISGGGVGPFTPFT